MKNADSQVMASPARSRFVVLMMFVILCASYSLNAMDRLIFPMLAADVRREFGFNLANVGLLSTIFTIGMAVAGVPTGFLLARLSRKVTFIIGTAIFSLGTVLTIVAHGFTDMLLYRASTSIGEAMQLTVLIAIATSYFARYRSTALGAINIFFGLGSIIGPVTGGLLLSHSHAWRFPLLVFGLIGVVAIAAIFLFVRPWFTEALAVREAQGRRNAPDTLWNRNTVILIILNMIAGMNIYAFLGMYPTFLREHLHFTSAMAGGVMGIYGFGVFASIIGGWLGDRVSPRKLLTISFLLTSVIGFLMFDAATTIFQHSLLAVCWGLVMSSTIYVNLSVYNIRAVSEKLNGRASGLFVTSLYGAAAFAGYTFGWLVSHGSWAVAGLTQVSGLCLIGAILSMALDSAKMAMSVQQTETGTGTAAYAGNERGGGWPPQGAITI